MKRILLVAAAALLVAWNPAEDALEPSDLIAQAGPTPVNLGDTITGELAIGDQTLNSGEWVDYYAVTVDAGQTLTISLNSAVFDTYLMLRGGAVSLDNDDMAMGNLNSQINTTIAAPGTYTIGVTSYQPGETGAYTLSIGGQVAGPGNPAPPSVGQAPTFSGTLAQGDQVLDSGEFVDYYTFDGAAGQRVILSMTSNEFDTYLGVFGPNGFQSANDDAPGMGLNSRLDLTLPTAGEYQIQATSYAAGMSGSYAIVMSDVDTTATQQTVPVDTSGTTQTGTLAYGDLQLNSGEFYDEYLVDGTAGEMITVDLNSSTFDTYVMIRGNGLTLDNDDVQPGNLNSQLVTTLPITGQYRVLVTSYAPGETGDYTLQISRSGEVPTTNATAIGGQLTADQPLQDTFTATDPTRREGQHFRTYTFQGTQGQRAVVDMSSPTVDTYLILRGPNGFEEHNDDIVYAQDTNSRIDMILPATGTYEVSASTYAPGVVGPYTLGLSFSGDRTLPVVTPNPLPNPTPNPTPTATGSYILGPQQGTLAAGDATLNTGEFLDSYSFQGNAGQGVTIDLSSDQFDTYIILTGPNGYQEDNDDFPGLGLNSRLEIGLPTTGTYTVGVTSYAPGETGQYTVSVQDGTSVTRAGRGRIYAVLAGITNYADGDVLPFCADDAIKLHEDLSRTGLLAPESQLLVNSQVTRANLEAAFQQIAQVITPEDQFIFFYSGHGFQLSTGDASELDGVDETIYVYDGNITDDVVAGWFDMIDARLATIALDSCFSGGFARDVISSSNRMGIFSSEEDVLSTTAERFQAGGFLSHFLRTGLAGAADQEPVDQVVTVGELTQFLRRQWAGNVLENRVESGDGTRTYQNLVIERGGVSLSDVMVYPPQP